MVLETGIRSKRKDGCHPNHWTVFEESSYLLLEVERYKYPIQRFDLLDGSVGGYWGHKRTKDKLTGNVIRIGYEMEGRKKVYVKGYPYEELGIFKLWLKQVYTPLLLPKYLKTKYGSIIKV